VSLELPAPTTSGRVAAVDLSPKARRGRIGRRTVVASAVTAAVLSVSGVAAAGIASGPGGPLYPIHKLLLGPRQTSSQHAADQVRRFLRLADADLTHDRLVTAGAELDNATN